MLHLEHRNILGNLDLALFPTPLGELRGKACQLD